MENRLKVLAPWQQKKTLLLKLQQQVKQKEGMLKQLKLSAKEKYIILEMLGRIIPSSCWLTSLEEKDQIMVLKGNAMDSSGVELLRKQLLSLENCQSCELLACQRAPGRDEINFTLKITL